jgi:hypothetical protein
VDTVLDQEGKAAMLSHLIKGMAMSIAIVFGRFLNSHIFRFATVMFILLTWGNYAFCSELHIAIKNRELQKVKTMYAFQRGYFTPNYYGG